MNRVRAIQTNDVRGQVNHVPGGTFMILADLKSGTKWLYPIFPLLVALLKTDPTACDDVAIENGGISVLELR